MIASTFYWNVYNANLFIQGQQKTSKQLSIRILFIVEEF